MFTLVSSPRDCAVLCLRVSTARQGFWNGSLPPIGVKNITAHLNRQRIFTRDGGRWGIGQIHRILTRKTYAGRHEFNEPGKTKELKPASEVIDVAVSAQIDQATFDAAQAHLRARNPGSRPSAPQRSHPFLSASAFAPTAPKRWRRAWGSRRSCPPWSRTRQDRPRTHPDRRAADVAANTFARWLNVLRSRKKRSASWDRRVICSGRSPPRAA